MARCPHELEKALLRQRCPHELEKVLLRQRYPYDLEKSLLRQRYPLEVEKVQVCQRIPPHHHCCHFPYESELEITRKAILSQGPGRIRKRCRPYSYGEYSWNLHQSPATVNPRIYHNIRDPTFCKLHKWFTRFDKTGRGYLEVDELGSLLRHKGASLPVSQLRKLFDEADANNDGRLSLEEFILLWHRAAEHENEFLSATDCRDFINIVRTHDLHPRVFCHYCDDFNSDIFQVKGIRQITDLDMADETVRCYCGSDAKIEPFVDKSGNKIEPFVDHTAAGVSENIGTSKKYDGGEHFVFSSNRRSKSPLEYKRQ